MRRRRRTSALRRPLAELPAAADLLELDLTLDEILLDLDPGWLDPGWLDPGWSLGARMAGKP